MSEQVTMISGGKEFQKDGKTFANSVTPCCVTVFLPGLSTRKKASVGGEVLGQT